VTPMASACFTQGYNAYIRYGIFASCPFERYSPQWREWYKGFTSAQVGPLCSFVRRY
jgi:hypothetical protein